MSKATEAELKLSLEINDKEKTIFLLQEAHKSTKLMIETEYENELHKWKSEYSTMNQQNKNDLNSLLNQTQKVLDKKKNLTENVILLDKEQKRLHSKTNEELKQIKRTIYDDVLAKNLQQLKENQYERAEKWLFQKSQEIKKKTLEVLKPRIDKLITSHSQKIHQMNQAFLKNKLHIERSLQLEYKTKLSKAKEEIHTKYHIHVFPSIQQTHLQRQEDLQAQHEKTLRELQDKLQNENKIRFDLEQRERDHILKMQENEIQQIKDAHIKRMADTSSEIWEKERLHIIKTYYTEPLEKFVSEHETIKKKQWEDNEVKAQESILSENLEKETKEQKRERDKQIDEYINLTQTELFNFNLDLERQFHLKKEKLQKENNETKKQVNDENLELQKKLSEINDKISSLTDIIKNDGEKQNLEAKLSKIVESTKKVNTKLSKVQEDCLKLQLEKKQKLVSIEATLKEQLSQIQRSNSEARNMLEKETKTQEELGKKYQQQINYLDASHNKELSDLDIDTRRKLKELQRKIDSLQNEKSERSIKCEHLEQMLVKYSRQVGKQQQQEGSSSRQN